MDGEEQLTERQLKIAGWYVEHKELLRRIGYGALLLFDVVTLGFGLYGYTDYFLFSWNKDAALRQHAATPLVSHEAVLRQAPQPLGVALVETFPGTSGKYDFIAKVRNINQNWYAQVTYQFVSRAGATPLREGFVLPAEEKYLATFGEEVGMPPGRPELQITKIEWHRVDRHVISDVSAWVYEHLNFVLSNVVHEPVFDGDTTVARTSFDVENRSAYGYWRPGVFVTLLRGDMPVATNYVMVTNFDAGEKRHIDVNWFESLPQSNRVDIQPDVNIFDANVYMPPRSP